MEVKRYVQKNWKLKIKLPRHPNECYRLGIAKAWTIVNEINRLTVPRETKFLNMDNVPGFKEAHGRSMSNHERHKASRIAKKGILIV